MPRTNLHWYTSKVRRIMKDVSHLKQKDIAEIEGVTRQAVCIKMKGSSYDESLSKWIQILDLAGYEIREKEEV